MNTISKALFEHSQMSSKADNISFGPVDKSSIGLLKIIHHELLPVHYSDSIYNIIKDGVDAKGILAYYNGDTAVGEICYRREEEKVENSIVKRIYIMTLGVLQSYQRLGIATKLVNKVIEGATDESEIYLHVHVDNQNAIEFYKKLGFQLVKKEEGYYKSLNNGDAYLFSKKITK